MPVNRYTARLLVGGANSIIARFGPTAPIYLHKGDAWTTTIRRRQPDWMLSDQHSGVVTFSTYEQSSGFLTSLVSVTDSVPAFAFPLRCSCGRAWFTFNVLPLRSVPLRATIASAASASVFISMKPNPLDRPVQRSVIILHRRTTPCLSKRERMSCSVTLRLRCNGSRSSRPMLSRVFPASFSDSFRVG